MMKPDEGLESPGYHVHSVNLLFGALYPAWVLAEDVA